MQSLVRKVVVMVSFYPCSWYDLFVCSYILLKSYQESFLLPKYCTPYSPWRGIVICEKLRPGRGLAHLSPLPALPMYVVQGEEKKREGPGDKMRNKDLHRHFEDPAR